VHCVTSDKTPDAGAAKPKCVEKKLICEFFETMLQILAKYHKARMPVTIIGQKIPGKNPRFEAVAEWAKQSFHESLVSISMIDNGLFEKYHFQAWKARSTLCIMCLGCKIKRYFLYLASWILKWCRRIPGLFQIPCLGLILRSQLMLAQSKLCQFVGKSIGEEGVVGRKW
jgi:hypothetical protein